MRFVRKLLFFFSKFTLNKLESELKDSNLAGFLTIAVTS
jgi:hypothetical protein